MKDENYQYSLKVLTVGNANVVMQFFIYTAQGLQNAPNAEAMWMLCGAHSGTPNVKLTGLPLNEGEKSNEK